MPIIGIEASAGMKPTTPTIGTATDGGTGTTVSVAFTPSTYIGKGTITYTATSSPGGLTGTGSGSPITVSGLTTGTAYTFTVQGATNYGVNSDASAASNSVTPASPSSFESIATAYPTYPGSPTVTFSSIPNTYKHLQIRIMGITLSGGLTLLQFNSDTGSNYVYHQFYGDGTSAASFGSTSQTSIRAGVGVSSGSYSNLPWPIIIDIHDYANTSKNKVIRSFTGGDTNGTNGGFIGFESGLWLNTSAINSIYLFTNGSPAGFNNGSIIALYGIKG